MRVNLAAQVDGLLCNNDINIIILLPPLQVLSESVASALQMLNGEGTRETRHFIRMIDAFFDCLNVKGTMVAKMKRKDSVAPYENPSDERFKVCEGNRGCMT
jgi:hypothetical protein